MGQSLVQIYVHVIFSTKGRAPLLVPEVRREVFGFLGEYLNREHCPCVGVGGVADHVRLLFRLGKGTEVESLIGELKSRSSTWIKARHPRLRGFYWQRGYAAYSLSSTHVAAAHQYILEQERHHRSECYEDEVRRILKKNRIEYDERYLFT